MSHIFKWLLIWLLEIRQKDLVRSMGDTWSWHVTSCSVLQLESESKGHCLMWLDDIIWGWRTGVFFWVALSQSFGNDSKIFQDIKQKKSGPYSNKTKASLLLIKKWGKFEDLASLMFCFKHWWRPQCHVDVDWSHLVPKDPRPEAPVKYGWSMREIPRLPSGKLT